MKVQQKAKILIMTTRFLKSYNNWRKYLYWSQQGIVQVEESQLTTFLGSSREISVLQQQQQPIRKHCLIFFF